MANVKELKKRIKSTKGTLKITKAMKLVSAAKLAKAQSKIVSLRPYANELEETLRTIAALSRTYSHPFFARKEEGQIAVLVISADKGLCGSYNSSVAKRVRKFLDEKSGEKMKFYFIGKKARDLVREQVEVVKSFKFKKVEPTLEEVRSISSELSDIFSGTDFKSVFVIYNSFNSAISFDTKIKQVLPLVYDTKMEDELKQEYPYDFKYDVDEESLLSTLVPEAYFTAVLSAVLDANASEHGSRMNAMENASKNSKEMIRKLTLKMNKMRQARITTELIEVVSGAESLNG